MYHLNEGSEQVEISGFIKFPLEAETLNLLAQTTLCAGFTGS